MVRQALLVCFGLLLVFGDVLAVEVLDYIDVEWYAPLVSVSCPLWVLGNVRTILDGGCRLCTIALAFS